MALRLDRSDNMLYFDTLAGRFTFPIVGRRQCYLLLSIEFRLLDIVGRRRVSKYAAAQNPNVMGSQGLRLKCPANKNIM